MSFKDELKILGALQFLDARIAEPLTFKSLNVPNRIVRNTMGLIAARRWPDHLLKITPVPFDEKDQINLMAVMIAFHPKLSEVLRQRFPGEQLSVASRKLRELGPVGLFYLSSTASMGF